MLVAVGRAHLTGLLVDLLWDDPHAGLVLAAGMLGKALARRRIGRGGAGTRGRCVGRRGRGGRRLRGR